MKKILATMLALLLILSMAASASALTPGNWDFGSIPGLVEDTAEDMIQGRTFTYDFNGGVAFEWTGRRVELITSATYESHGTHTIPEMSIMRVGYRFTGWLHPNGVIYQPGDQLHGGPDITLVAQWEKK